MAQLRCTMSELSRSFQSTLGSVEEWSQEAEMCNYKDDCKKCRWDKLPAFMEKLTKVQREAGQGPRSKGTNAQLTRLTRFLLEAQHELDASLPKVEQLPSQSRHTNSAKRWEEPTLEDMSVASSSTISL
eukprot:TRINITY_DN47673_c0_g1_i1.p1 TRINITY_DN47673_c0_g1~~TRINITY_DN47673_c0_g1_i1.p1  ORF type:complete len:129 (-),score=25.39 TRINITY_DN47673_c0_g1_i1:60-446(-)